MRIDEIFGRKQQAEDDSKRHTKNLKAHATKSAKEAGVTDRPDGDKELAKHRATHGKPKSRKDYDDEHDRLMGEIKKTVGEIGDIGKKETPAKKTGPNSRPESRVTK